MLTRERAAWCRFAPPHTPRAVRRSVIKEGAALPAEITPEHLADDALLIPVLEDDALIFCLDDLPEPPAAGAAGQRQGQEKGKEEEEEEGKGKGKGKGGPQVEELLQKNARLQAELEQLAKQFTNYRLAVEQTLDRRWGVDEESEKGESAKGSGADVAATATAAAAAGAGAGAGEKKDDDDSADYFESYAHNGMSSVSKTFFFIFFLLFS